MSCVFIVTTIYTQHTENRLCTSSLEYLTFAFTGNDFVSVVSCFFVIVISIESLDNYENPWLISHFALNKNPDVITEHV